MLVNRVVCNFTFVSLQECVLGLTDRCRFFINDTEVSRLGLGWSLSHFSFQVETLTSLGLVLLVAGCIKYHVTCSV